jgi:hypothetical protein
MVVSKIMIEQLCTFIKDGNLKGIEQLLDQRAVTQLDINSTSDDGCTPLILAARVGNLNAVNLLLKHGANISIATCVGHTALIYAIEQGYTDIAKVLIAADIQEDSINRVPVSKKTPLYLASERGYEDLVEILLSKKVKVNISSFFGKGPLCIAAENGHLAVVRKLLNSGARVKKECLPNVSNLIIRGLLNGKLYVPSLKRNGQDRGSFMNQNKRVKLDPGVVQDEGKCWVCDCVAFLGYCKHDCLGRHTDAIAVKHISLNQTRDNQKFPWDLYFNQLKDPKTNRPYGIKIEGGYARPAASYRTKGYVNSTRWEYDVDTKDWIVSPRRALHLESRAFRFNECRAKKTPFTLCNHAKVGVFGHNIKNLEEPAYGGAALLVSVTQDRNKVRAFPVNSRTCDKPWISDTKPKTRATSIAELSTALDKSLEQNIRAPQNEVLLKVKASDIIGIRQLYDTVYSRLESILRVCQVYCCFGKRVPIVQENSGRQYPFSPFNVYKTESDQQLVALMKQALPGCHPGFIKKLCVSGTVDSKTTNYFIDLCLEASRVTFNSHNAAEIQRLRP